MVLVAVGQITSTANISTNLAQCLEVIQRAVAMGAKALFLPEASDYIGSSPTQTVSLVKSIADSEFVQGLCSAVRKHQLPIHVGIHEPGVAQGKVQNTLIWIDETGKIVHRYHKIHLFDVEIFNGPVLKESACVERGNEVPKPFNTVAGKVGPAICFDLRFPEVGLALKRQGADIITYPSAFTVPTGQAHWEVLLRARAIEAQSYVIAAAQAGFHNDRRRSYGHSMIIDPWGKIIAELDGDSSPCVAVAEIDHEYLTKIRTEMPLLRRTDIYPEV